MADQTNPAAPGFQAPLRTAPSAVWSLILGILSFICAGPFTAVPAIICGHVALSSIRKSLGSLGGRGMAITGLILGYIALILFIAIIAIALVLGVSSIPLLEKARRQAEQTIQSNMSISPSPGSSSSTPSFNGKDLASSDGNIHFTIPLDWEELSNLNQSASVQAGNKGSEKYLMVISESKADLANMDLQKHHQITRDAMLKKMQNSSGTSTQSLTISGYPALQDELSGTQNGVEITFLHTTVDAGDQFHQILAWSLKDRWPLHNRELRQITATFRTSR